MINIDERFKLLIEDKDIAIKFEEVLNKRKKTTDAAEGIELAGIKALKNIHPNITAISIAGPVSALAGTVAIMGASSLPMLSAVCGAAAIYGVCKFSKEIMKLGSMNDNENELKSIISFAKRNKDVFDNKHSIDSIENYKKNRDNILNSNPTENEKSELIKEAQRINNNINFAIENEKDLQWINTKLDQGVDKINSFKSLLRKNLKRINENTSTDNVSLKSNNRLK